MAKKQFMYNFKIGVETEPVIGGSLYDGEKLPVEGREKSHKTIEYLEFSRKPVVENRFNIHDGVNIHHNNRFTKISYANNSKEDNPYKSINVIKNISDNPDRSIPMAYF